MQGSNLVLKGTIRFHLSAGLQVSACIADVSTWSRTREAIARWGEECMRQARSAWYSRGSVHLWTTRASNYAVVNDAEKMIQRTMTRSTAS